MFDCYLFWKTQSLVYGEKQVWLLMWFRSWNFWALSVNYAFELAQKRDFFQSCATCRKFLIGNLMEDFRLVVTKKKQFEYQDFTMSVASFRRIGNSGLQLKDQSIWLSNQVCLLKYKGFDWHSDGLNQNWVELEPTNFDQWDIIHNISTPWNF